MRYMGAAVQGFYTCRNCALATSGPLSLASARNAQMASSVSDGLTATSSLNCCAASPYCSAVQHSVNVYGECYPKPPVPSFSSSNWDHCERFTNIVEAQAALPQVWP